MVGSVALDSLNTLLGEVTETVEGSATFFCAEASDFTDVQLIAVVKEYPPPEHFH